jgi:hypothetical protein
MSGSEPYPFIGFQITTELSQLTIFRAANKTNAVHLIEEKPVAQPKKLGNEVPPAHFPGASELRIDKV